jgi:D-alanine transaminase
MSRIVYVNGDYLAEEDAKISVFDRGFLFADGIYEVTSVLHGRLVDNASHLERLARSARELEMPLPLSAGQIEAVQQEMVRRNGLEQGMLYLQVTRGAADRDFAYPARPQPSLVMFTQSKSLLDNPSARRGISVITLEDLRWRRRDIKTVQLLFPSMAKQAALEAGADDAWLVENGHVNEGTSNNAWIVRDLKIVTRELSNDILHGITRRAVMRLARETGMAVEERAFTVAEALEADEAFVTSASAFVLPVVRIDGQMIGNGQPGAITARLRQFYIEEACRA